MTGQQINPRLIEALSDEPIRERASSPTFSQLNSNYASQIRKKKAHLSEPLPVNQYMLKCNSCGRKGKYNIGLLVVNVDVKSEKTEFQMTGYFRCKHCNQAGDWEGPKDLYFLATSALLAPEEMKDRCHLGKNMLYDGTVHKYATDAEEHTLNKLQNDPNNSFIWNRLGNLYQKGGRPELAASAFEKSLSIDSKQVESHYTLGSLLAEVGNAEMASYHFRKMLLHASEYRDIDALSLRDLLSNGLLKSFLLYQQSQGEVPFLPTQEELMSSGKLEDDFDGRVLEELELIGDDITSFYPLAEMYMGDRTKELPMGERLLKGASGSSFKRKKKKKRTKRNRR